MDPTGLCRLSFLSVSAHKQPDVPMEAQWQKTKIKTKWRRRQGHRWEKQDCATLFTWGIARNLLSSNMFWNCAFWMSLLQARPNSTKWLRVISYIGLKGAVQREAKGIPIVEGKMMAQSIRSLSSQVGNPSWINPASRQSCSFLLCTTGKSSTG